ncbi:MAG TPA: IclR family transcriptional regulator [Symbiobacteriaceae bacterium]|nr:IclR family transcriptional regulator [Symbiobacteriaceae bacterium]
MTKESPERLAPRSAAADSGQLQTLHRALDLLEALAAGGEASVANLSETLGLARSTTHRLLTTLTSRGYVKQDAAGGRYRVGLRTFEVGSSFLTQNPLKDVARPIMRELVQQFNETVSLALLDGDAAVYVDMVESNQTPRTFARVGARVPLYATGVGKAMLMGMTSAELQQYFKDRRLKAYTSTTLTSPDTLRSEFQRAQAMGYVLDREEYQVGVRCGAAPVRDHSGRAFAALSISGPAYRIVDKVWLTASGAVAAAALELSRSLGYK